jgi:linoleoyl-CoA desaturase
MRKAKFTNTEINPFYKTLNKRVNEYFNSHGISKHANIWMITKIIICFLLYLLFYAIIISDIMPPIYQAICVFLFGFSCALLGFNVAHDASHGALFSSHRLNNLLSYSFEFIGISSYAWHVKHNVVHHNNPNLQNGDFDIEGAPILRFSPADKRLPHYRFQHLYAPLAYLLLSLAMLFFLDIKVVFLSKRETIDGKTHPFKQRMIFVIAKILYLFFMLVLPIILLDYKWWQILLGFTTMHFTLSIILSIILIPAHVFENTEYPILNDNGRINGEWALYQMRTTMDYSRKSKLCNFLFGGLNINVVHHLFPKICHVHLMAISDIVRQTSDEFGITYHENSIWGAMKTHFKELRKLGENNDGHPHK